MLPIEKFKETLKESRLYNPVFNFTALAASVGWYDYKFYDCYENKPKDPIASLSNKDISIWYITYEQLMPLSLEFGINYFINKEKTESLLDEYLKYSKIVNEKYTSINIDDYISKGEERSLSELKEMIEAERYTNAAGWFSIYFDRELLENVLKNAGVNIQPDKIEEIVEKSSDPLNGSFDVRSELKILELIEKGLDTNTVAIHMQYKFAGFSGCDSLEKVRKSLQKELGKYFNNKQKAAEKIIEIKNDIETRKKSFLEWQNTLTDFEKKCSDYIQLVSTMKDSLRDYIGMGICSLYRIGIPLIEKAGIESKYMKFILLDEIFEGSDYVKNISEEIKNRENGFGFVMYPDGQIYKESTNISSAKDELETLFMKQNGLEQNSDTTIIKGQSASKGFVKGIVRKILDLEKEGSSMKEGEILVTGMTRPEYVPLMKIASAIITDEGGITCHAAIVSRELKIPCIIGTKIATKVLKTGDLVEVDADNGTVKIIN